MTLTAMLAVDGMTCNGCVRSVTNAIARVPGVSKVDVSLADKRATVDYDPAAANPEALVAAVVDAGFSARAAT